MTVGNSSANLGTPLLNHLRGTNTTAPTALYVKLHTGDPGASGASNASANTTRVVITFAAPSSNAIAMNGTAPAWNTWAAGSETISHFSIFDASTSGNFLFSVALTASKAMTNGDNLVVASFTYAITPVAA